MSWPFYCAPVCGQSAAAKTPDDQKRLRREINASDGRIDRLVYESYGLTEEEIRIVEGSV